MSFVKINFRITLLSTELMCVSQNSSVEMMCAIACYKAKKPGSGGHTMSQAIKGTQVASCHICDEGKNVQLFMDQIG